MRDTEKKIMELAEKCYAKYERTKEVPPFFYDHFNLEVYKLKLIEVLKQPNRFKCLTQLLDYLKYETKK